MSGVGWIGKNRTGYLQVVDWFQGMDLGYARETHPIRTVYNATTHQYEEIPLTQFQHLLRAGKIEESVSERPDGSSQTVYRLV